MEEQIFTLKLNLNTANIILVSLSKQPYEAVFQTIEDLKQQLSAQIKQEDPIVE